MKFLKFIKREYKKHFSETVSVMSQRDVDFLVALCRYCRIMVKTYSFFTDSTYGYYVPKRESDLEVAQQIFAKSGIRMCVHDSHILDEYNKSKVLRINYNSVANPEILKQELGRIERGYRLSQEFASLVQTQNQR